LAAVVKVASQPIELSLWYTKYIEDTVNVHKYDSYIIPDDDIYEDGVMASIQPDVYDEFSVQIQIQSLSITDDNFSQSSSE